MKKVLLGVICVALWAIILGGSFSGCKKEKNTYLGEKVGEILKKYNNWSDNDLAAKVFEDEMISLFNDSKNMEFHTFYDDTIEFDEVIETSERFVNNSDSVAVRFRVCFYKDYTSINFDVITLFHKNDAINFSRNKKYKIDGKILTYLEDVYLDKSSNKIMMGYIIMKDNKIKEL